MKLASFLWRGTLAGAVLLGGAQYWLVQQTHAAAAALSARLIPYGSLRYDKLWPNLWGTGTVWGPSFEPGGMLALNFQTPPGYRLQARELRIHELAFDDTGVLERVRGSLIGLQVPVLERHAEKVDAADPADVPGPTLADLGYSELSLDLDFQVQYVPDAQLALARVDSVGEGIGRAHLEAQLEGSPGTFSRAPDQILIRRLALEFADGGLLQRYKELAAGRSRVSRQAWEQAMIARLDRLTAQGKWRWDEASALAMRRAIRESSYFRAAIDPPSDVALRNIRLYPVGDWPRLLGFSFASEGVFEHPLPLAAQR